MRITNGIIAGEMTALAITAQAMAQSYEQAFHSPYAYMFSSTVTLLQKPPVGKSQQQPG